jgi:Mg/Co/Ni transporter MgtE
LNPSVTSLKSFIKKGYTIDTMPLKDKRISSSDASVLNELKDTIQRQAKEIEQLKLSLSQKTSAAASTSGGHHHHHGSSANDDTVSGHYLSSPFYKLALKRVGWLSFFLMSLSLTAVIINGFEHTLSRQIELAYFVPLLAGHGGNTGGQTVGTVLSALSTGSISTKDAFKVITKEAASGMMVGLLLGCVVGPIAHFVGGISTHVATVIFFTLPVLSTIAATLASSIPFLCTMVGLDPALISAPAMTTFVDVSGLLSYFLIANRVFKAFGIEL